MSRRWWLGFGILLATLAPASTTDPRGWHSGTLAPQTRRVLDPLPQRVVLDLPEHLRKLLNGPTVLVYFSPTCHHCQAVAPELEELSKRLGPGKIVGVATGGALQEDISAFNKNFGMNWQVVHDIDGSIASVLRVGSTPSAVMIRPDGKDWIVADYWYPYLHGFDTLVEMRFLEKPWQAFRPGEYHGNGTCSACHTTEAESWSLTHHSIAWSTLVERGKQIDPACTHCHVTGATTGGWNGAVDSPLVDVGCEACHGPGGPHDGARIDAKTTCAGCHDEQHSIAFSVDKGLPLIDHYRTIEMSDDRFLEERRKLANGEVPRKLLDFAIGDTVGSSACIGCHPTEHTAWKADPHAQAMKRLDAHSADDPSCVRCHATANRSGPTPTSIHEYRVEESVSCESCHGPGKAHVDSKGAKGTIEGLGKDCPVCVIEAMCTSCHTKTWDPNWNLDEKLPKVHHGVK